MNKLSGFDWVAIVLLIIGGLNWGLIGIFKWDLVSALFGYMGFITRLIYILVGLSAIYLIFISSRLAKK